MKIFSKFAIVAVGAVALLSTPAAASTYTLDFSDPTVQGTISATATTGIVQEGQTGSVGGQYTSPWSGTNVGASFTAVREDSTAVYDFGTNVQTSLSFLWGSIDTYNSLTFYLNNSVVEVFDTAAVITTAGGISGFYTATISIQDIMFDQVTFGSAGNSFEYANLNVSVVPLPAALPLYGAGVALMGFLGWRKRKNAA